MAKSIFSVSGFESDNNNNGYLKRLSRTGPKRLRVL